MSDYQFESESEPEGTPAGAVDWDNVEYGGFWIRFVAMIIDDIITGILFIWLLGMVVMGINPLAAAGDSSGFLVQFLLPAAYTIGFWIAMQATPGKMALGLVVVDAKTGQPASAGKYVLRFLGYIVSTIVLFLGFIWVAFNPRKQGWHDLIAGTVVVKKGSL